LIDLADHLTLGANTINITQFGSGQIYYYLRTKQILRSDPAITVTNQIYTSPNQEFSIELNLTHESEFVFPVNVLVECLESELTLIGPAQQNLQILNGSVIFTFNFIAPDLPGNYFIDGFKISYLFADSSFEYFSGIIQKNIAEIPISVQSSLISQQNIDYPINRKIYQEPILVIKNEYDINLTRTYSKVENFRIGDIVTVELLIENSWESKEFIMIEEYIPTGFEIDISSLVKLDTIVDYRISNGKLTLFILNLDLGITSISYRLIAFDVGASIALPALLSSMYDSWTVLSETQIIGSLNVNIDPSTGQLKTDTIKPTFIGQRYSILDREISYEVSLSITAYDNDDVYIVNIHLGTENGLWKTIEGFEVKDYGNKTKDFKISLGEFNDEELLYIVSIEDKSGNVYSSEFYTIVVPAVTIAFIFVFLMILVSVAFASTTSIITIRLRPKRKSTNIFSDNREEDFHETKEDEEAYKKIDLSKEFD
jgi:hypothetical protein